ncbi:hypothetical protein CONPUDRAFT_170286 [Coniophora puteana RWD-64-598 SS2]|uniref:RBR-type E3 ubiquitin transferase n=1 Tax=Coniophora puteana (strain RWD-64-598) TaxID=741705 RepID=R7SDQ5_CONPW|nr:uncharacterized protein CONPUDRAFT_170286 [Coniophora puteana RWD-64-598 SS2]EIW74296.1 hypothetical protein CONPUDRAFT_170286 [Coniophora puteana RWD-64-598 SS2]
MPSALYPQIPTSDSLYRGDSTHPDSYPSFHPPPKRKSSNGAHCYAKPKKQAFSPAYSSPSLLIPPAPSHSSVSTNLARTTSLKGKEKANCTDSAFSSQYLLHGCIVTLSAGLAVKHVVSPFNLCVVRVRGLSANATRKDVNDLLALHGIDPVHFFIKKIDRDADQVDVELLMDAAKKPCLSCLTHSDPILRVFVEPYIPPGSLLPTAQSQPNTLLVSWPAPCVDYTVNYLDEDDASAQIKVDELDGKRCAGRPVRVRLNTLPPGTREPPLHWRANSIIITDVPLWAKDEDVRLFSGSPFVRRSEGRLFDAEAAVRWMERDIRWSSRGEFEYTRLSEGADPIDGTVRVQATFRTLEEAKLAKAQLERKSCDYIARGKREVRMPDPYEYGADITADEDTIAQLAALCDITAARRQGGCNAWMEHTTSGARIHISGSKQAAVGALKVRVEELVQGDRRKCNWSSESDDEDQLHFSAPSTRSSNASSGDCLSSCPICLDVISAPVFLECGHAYCRGCLEHFLSVAASSPSADNGQQMFPLQCAHCKASIPLPQIASFLTSTQFEFLQKSAFDSYLAQHPKELRWCPTPGCSQIYSFSSSDESGSKKDEHAQCPSCFSRVCTTYKAAVQPEVEERETNTWVSRQSGRVAPCPSCGVLIEKGEGCNHVACRCGTHICWKCLQTFDSKDVYKHMNAAHGGIGMPEPMPPVDIAEQQVLLRQAEERRRQQRDQEQRERQQREREREQQQQQHSLHHPHSLRPPQPRRQDQHRWAMDVEMEMAMPPVAFLNGYGPVNAQELAELRAREQRLQREAEREARLARMQRGGQRPVTWGGFPNHVQDMIAVIQQRDEQDLMRRAQDDRGCAIM